MKNKLFFLFTFFLSLFLIYTAEAQTTQEEIYVIRKIDFNIDGRTRPFALVINGEFTEGERIEGKENLERYIEKKTQLLMNQRILEEANVEYSLGMAEEDGAIPVYLLVSVKDTFNFIILPYPQYDSNSGFSLTLKMRDYNFLGTMSPLRVDLGYSFNNGNHEVNMALDSDIPFQYLGLNWVFNFDHNIAYTFNEPVYYQNVTGLAINLPWEMTTFTVGFNQYLTVNEKNSEENIDIYGLADRYYGAYASTELFTKWKIPFGIEIGDFGDVSYTPGLSGKINYPYGKMDEPRSPVTTFSHTLGFGRINWIGNYRKGLVVSLNNDYSWFFDRTDAPMRITFDGGLSFYWPFHKLIGISTRLRYRQWWHWSDRAGEWIPYYNAGDQIRGILDADLRADYMISFNLDIPFRLIRFWPSEWFNKPKLHFFDFEMHFSPFIDIAMMKGPYAGYKDDPYEGSSFGLKNILYSGGLELIVYPGFFRSFYIRFSIGYNLNDIKNNGLSKKWGFFPQWNEIFIGVDHFY